MDVPLADVSIRVASTIDAADEVAYIKALGPILATFPQITVRDYWELTCAEHASLVLYLKGSLPADVEAVLKLVADDDS